MNIKLVISQYIDKLGLKKLKSFFVEHCQSSESFLYENRDENETLFQLYKSVYLQSQKIVKTIEQYEWVQQLNEASTRDVIKITLLSSFFINILALAFPLALMQVYDRVIPNQTYSTLVTLCVGVVIAISLETVLRIARSYINLWADAKYEYQLSTKAFNNLLHVPLYVYENTDIGTRIKQFSVLDQMRGFYNNQLLASICDIPFLIPENLTGDHIHQKLCCQPSIKLSSKTT